MVVNQLNPTLMLVGILFIHFKTFRINVLHPFYLKVGVVLMILVVVLVKILNLQILELDLHMDLLVLKFVLRIIFQNKAPLLLLSKTGVHELQKNYFLKFKNPFYNKDQE